MIKYDDKYCILSWNFVESLIDSKNPEPEYDSEPEPEYDSEPEPDPDKEPDPHVIQIFVSGSDRPLRVS